MTNLKKCIFLDRDGVINRDKVDYVYKPEELFIIDGVPQALKDLKNAGYLLIIITNQSGIAKGLFTKEDVLNIHRLVQEACENSLDAIYMAPYHESVHNSLSRKPGSLMFERAAAKFKVDFSNSWMIGDKERDLVPAKKFGMKTILVDNPKPSSYADYSTKNLYSASKIILQ